MSKSKLIVLSISMDSGQVTVVLLSLDKMLGHEKQFKPSPFDKKFKNQA